MGLGMVVQAHTRYKWMGLGMSLGWAHAQQMLGMHPSTLSARLCIKCLTGDGTPTPRI
jgi:hypothetical protein